LRGRIEKLNAAARWATNPVFSKIEIPTLQEVFDFLKDHPTVRVNLEIKDRDRWLAKKVAEMIRNQGFSDRVLLASGWDSVVEEIRHEFRQEPNVATSASVLEIVIFQSMDGERPQGNGENDFTRCRWHHHRLPEYAVETVSVSVWKAWLVQLETHNTQASSQLRRAKQHPRSSFRTSSPS
jgi:hypothetical protein